MELLDRVLTIRSGIINGILFKSIKEAIRNKEQVSGLFIRFTITNLLMSRDDNIWGINSFEKNMEYL